MNKLRRVVFDCNVFLQAMISSRGPARECWRKIVAGEATLYISQAILAELRSLPEHPRLRRFRELSSDRVAAFTAELLEVAILIDAPQQIFQYPRDPDDAHYVNLAIATGSMLVVSNDRDLLDLMNDDNADGRSIRTSFPEFEVLTPPEFLAALASDSG